MGGTKSMCDRLWCGPMTSSPNNLWLLIFSHTVGHTYVIYLALSTASAASNTACFFLAVVFAIPVVLFVYLRITGKVKKNRLDSNHRSCETTTDYKVEARSTEMDIEGPPRIPLRSALCPEMAGLLVLR
jgi:hypothetical protein